MFKFAQYSWRLAVVTLALLWLFQSSALAAIYHWKDDRGRPHFTDDISKIPLKYQQDIKKFKGVPPPPGAAKEEAAEEESEEQASLTPGPETEAGAAQDPVNEEAEKEAEKEAEPQRIFTPEELALLKETHKVLMKIRRGKINFVNSAEPTEANGEQYVKVAQTGGKLKKKMAKKISKSNVPSLMEAKAYMKKSASRDRMAKTGGSLEAFERRIRRLKKRMDKEITQEKEIIEKLRADLGIEAPPLESLEDIKAKKIAEAAKKKKKSRSPGDGGFGVPGSL